MKTSARLVGTILTAAVWFHGCKPSKEECDKFQSTAFDQMGAAQKCNVDQDCRNSEWPGCPTAISQATFSSVDKLRSEFKTKGCEETKQECRPPAEPYCKQGLCAYRYVDCGKLAAEALAKVKEPQPCMSHGDCRNSDWPLCSQAVTEATSNATLRLFSEFRSNECRTPKPECEPPTLTACRSGTCVHLAPGEQRDPPDGGEAGAMPAVKK